MALSWKDLSIKKNEKTKGFWFNFSTNFVHLYFENASNGVKQAAVSIENDREVEISDEKNESVSSELSGVEKASCEKIGDEWRKL